MADHQNGGPGFVRGRGGAGRFSLAALQERIELQLGEELTGRGDILQEIGDEQAQRALIRETADYVLAVESITLTVEERHALYAAVYRSAFGFGPLDDLIRDSEVTEIVVEGADRLFARRGAGELVRVSARFEDTPHLRRIVARILALAGRLPQDEDPVLELGMTLYGRPARLNAVLAPLSPAPHFTLRLHSQTPATLEGLARRGMLDAQGAALLQALIASLHGLLITGDAGAGKTTLLEALLGALPADRPGLLVERAPEIRSPVHVTRPAADGSFAEAIAAALAARPAVLALDEARGDEAPELLAALESDTRLLIVLRGSTEPARLLSALEMLLRRGRPALAEADLTRWLVTRLPFVILLHGAGDRLSVSEWQTVEEGLRLAPVLTAAGGTLARPRHDLALPGEFWDGG